MSNPFPGMNPYLESPTYWRGFYGLFIAALTSQLNRTLPDGFSANPEERVYIGMSDNREIIPDVVVTVPRTIPSSSLSFPAGGGLAVFERTRIARGQGEVELILPVEEIKERFIEITTTDTPHEVVMVIEILSPTNKRFGSEGWEQYRSKQKSLLHSTVHLLEIDLLIQGTYAILFPRNELDTPLPDYRVSLHRGLTLRSEPHRFHAWTFGLRDRLPAVMLPLTRGTPDFLLNLQDSFQTAFENGPYQRQIDYDSPPPVALSSDDAAWIDALLREKGVRQAPIEEVTK